MSNARNKTARLVRPFIMCIIAIAVYEATCTSDWISSYSYLNLDEFILPGNIKPEGYLGWLLEERDKSRPLQVDVHYRCQSGLGHQLLRFSAVYHLAMLYEFPRIWPTANPMCGGTIFTIYNYLLGPSKNLSAITQPLLVDVPYFNSGHDRRENIFRNRSLFQLPRSFPNLTFVNETTLSDEIQRSLIRGVDLNNQVRGYNKFRKENNFWGKDQSDYQFYEQLMLMFSHEHASTIRAAMDHTNFTKHTVFGLHIRAGNGEKGDFEHKLRGMHHIDQWLAYTMLLFCSYKEEHPHFFYEKPLMIFVGTDTPSVILKLQSVSEETCQIPVTSAPQVYPEDGSGVTYDTFATADEEKFYHCLNGWRDMFLDMYMFTQCNTVVAGTYSSFTQSAPLSYVMHKAKLHSHHLEKTTSSLGGGGHPHYFCEMGKTGQRMDCYDTLGSWMVSKTTALSWGDLDTLKQKVKYEVFFPDLGSIPGLAQLFDGTALIADESDV